MTDLRPVIRPAPLDSLVPVLRATAADRERRGQAIWAPEGLTVPALERAYPQAQGYAAYEVVYGAAPAHEGEPVVGAMLLVPADAVFWPHDPPGEALYLHKLAVHPDWQGRGLGRALLDAAAQATRGAGRSWLRLDTAAGRPQLRAVYDTSGFRLVREGRCGPHETAWYELRV